MFTMFATDSNYFSSRQVISNLQPRLLKGGGMREQLTWDVELHASDPQFTRYFKPTGKVTSWLSVVSCSEAFYEVILVLAQLVNLLDPDFTRAEFFGVVSVLLGLDYFTWRRKNELHSLRISLEIRGSQFVSHSNAI